MIRSLKELKFHVLSFNGHFSFIFYFGIKLCIVLMPSGRWQLTQRLAHLNEKNIRSLRCINWVHGTHSHALIKHWMGWHVPFSSGPYLKQKHQKYIQNLLKGVFALIALSSNSQISFQKSISLPNLLRIAEQRKSIDIEIVLSLDKKLLVKGLGEQNELFRLSRTTSPSVRGRIYLANKNPIN